MGLTPGGARAGGPDGRGGKQSAAARGEHLTPRQAGPRVIWHVETLPSAGERLVTTGKVASAHLMNIPNGLGRLRQAPGQPAVSGSMTEGY